MSTSTEPGPLRVALDEQEWRLVSSLREIGEGPLRDRMATLIRELFACLAEPGCSETQADGVPCEDAHMSCDRCRHVIALLDTLQSRLRER